MDFGESLGCIVVDRWDFEFWWGFVYECFCDGDGGVGYGFEIVVVFEINGDFIVGKRYEYVSYVGVIRGCNEVVI